MIEWFTKATDRVQDYKYKINELRLSVIYDFIKEFPMLYIEVMTKQEIARYTAMEERLHEQLEEIQKRKAHAMRKLD